LTAAAGDREADIRLSGLGDPSTLVLGGNSRWLDQWLAVFAWSASMPR